MNRIGILANTFEPIFGENAGGHIHFIEVAKRWSDVELVVFAPTEARFAMARELPDAKFVTMPSSDLLTGSPQLRNLSRVLLSLLRLRALRSCDALLCSSHFLPDVFPAVVARGAKCVVCIHHLLGVERWINPVARAISLTFQSLSLRLVRAFCRVIVANDPQAVAAVGITSPRFHVAKMRHGVDHLADWKTGAVETFTATYLGRLVPTKNLEDALQAWAIVARAIPTARLAVAGAGDEHYVESLRRLASHLGIDEHVEFLGRVSDANREALYRGSRMFLFPSREEGWGIVVAEAMSYGLPCVTYDLPAFRRDFTRGRLVAPIGNVDQLAAFALELIRDDDLHRRISDAARELARAFSWEEAAQVEFDALEIAAAL